MLGSDGDSEWTGRRDLLQDSELAHAALEVVLELDELAHVVLVIHRVQQRRVDEGGTQDVDADAVVALSRGVLRTKPKTRQDGC